MRNVFLWMVSIVLFTGCISSKSPASSDIHQLQESTSSAAVDKGVYGEKSGDYSAVGYPGNILLSDDAVSVAAPSTISLFAGDEQDEIGFIYEYGLSLTQEDMNTDLPEDEYGNKYLYFGRLNPVEDNVYSSSGEVIPSWEVLEGNIKKDVDFYVILDDHKFYLVFEDLPIEDLKNYTSDNYYTFYND